jgi:AcrR family transcriptional regulator
MTGQVAVPSVRGDEPPRIQRIRDAALRLFVRHGTEAVSLRTIAKAAGVSVGLVQHHFTTKDNLIQAVDDYVMMVLTESLAAPLASAPGDPVADAADRVTSLFCDHIEVVDYLSRALIDGAPIGVRVFDGLVEICTGYWAQIQQQGLTQPDLDPIWMVLNPLTMVLGMFMLSSHLSRHLPEPLATPTQLQRWRDATEVIIASGQLRRPGPEPH